MSPLQPDDEHNRKLAANVGPRDWQNPEPASRYNLVVLGAGTAGLVTAAGAAGMGAKVALVERALLGGDCLNVGCVPSKGMISSGRIAAKVRDAGSFGIHCAGGHAVDFAAVMRRMRRLRAEISANDAASRYRDLGVDVFLGQGQFVARDKVRVGDATLCFKKAVIATGARAAAPKIPGLEQTDFLDNESLFSLTELPPRLGVIGAGPIGCELAQTFARLGSEVLMIETEHGVLPREERTAAEIVQHALADDGVELLCCGRATSLFRDTAGIHVHTISHGQEHDRVVDKLLVAVGRTPNLEDLNLQAVGVAHNQRGVEVDDFLRTTNSKIYAAGDICSAYQFTHAADFMARIVIRNALFLGRAKMSRLMIPWCTYTSPELAHVGLYEGDAQRQNIAIDSYAQEMREVDRAILDGEDRGHVQILARKGTDKILGATIVADHAGDMISEITLAMTQGIGLGKIAATIHPYPTQAEAIRKLGDLYNRSRLTPRAAGMLRRWLAWTR